MKLFTATASYLAPNALRAAGSNYGPGLLASVVVAMAATFLSEHYGGPVMLFALLLGMSLNFLSREGRCVTGIDLAAKKVLRIGVALLGARITVEQILDLGIGPVAIVLSAVAATILFGAACGRLLGLGGRFGVLTGGAVAICGASAAMALAAVLPKGPTAERDTIFTVISVTTLSTIAMIAYPIAATALGLDPTEAGVFLGGTIHDVAQVVGAGYSLSPETGDVATFTKLLRVATLLPVVFALSLWLRRRGFSGGEAAPPIPGFLVAFAVLVGINSSGYAPEFVMTSLVEASRWCLVAAISALGMKTSLQALAQVGGGAISLIIAETLFLAALVVGLIALLL